MRMEVTRVPTIIHGGLEVIDVTVQWAAHTRKGQVYERRVR